MTVFRVRRSVFRAIVALSASAVLLSGCASGAPAPSPDGPAADEAGVLTAAEQTAEQADWDAMDCVTGAWEATTGALQALFDQAIAEAGLNDYQIIVDGSIVYEFLETGFGVNVIPTAFTMTMPTVVGDVVGEINGQASALLWGVKGGDLQVVGEEWQNGLTMRWTFSDETIDADTGAQSMVQGLTDINSFTCAGDELVLQSKGGPPLALRRMTELK